MIDRALLQGQIDRLAQNRADALARIEGETRVVHQCDGAIALARHLLQRIEEADRAASGDNK